MAIYSLPLAAVLVAAALRHHHVPAQTMALDALLVLEQQLKRLLRDLRGFRARCALDLSLVAAQLHDADAQLALAQLRLQTLDFPAPGYPRHLDTNEATIQYEDAASAMSGDLHDLEELVARQRALVRRACIHADAANATIEGFHAALATLQQEADALQTRHFLQLSALYDALTKKRLALRALDARYKHVVIANKLRLHGLDDDEDEEKEEEEDPSMAMLDDEGEESGDDAVSDDDDAVVFKEASI